MEETATTTYRRLAWAVLSKAQNSKSEVIKITDHEDADRLVLENPEGFYKSGPFLLPS
jgi:hypothetical protein